MTHVERCIPTLGALGALALAAAVLAAPGRARAQGAVEAEVLFEDGRRLLKDGKLADACDKFEASERIESTVGVLLNAGDCREKNHQLATAWALFVKAAALAHHHANDSRREAEARRRADLLASRLSYLTISVPDSSKIEGLVIRRGGGAVDPALWNQGVPVDEGVYEISATAPGHEPWSTSVTVGGEGARAVVEVPRFKRLEDMIAPPAMVPPVTVVPARAEPAATSAQDAGRGRFTVMRKASVGVAVAGVAALGVAVGFGLKASDLRGQADAICAGAMCGDRHAISLNDDAKRAATRANLLFVAGGALTATATALWLLGTPHAPSSAELAARPVVAPGALGVAVSGRF